jgi:uncharacterized protein YdhG (YjbR/CyaY superfamily)
MRSGASTVAEYLASLPDDRREAIAAVREVILRNLPSGYLEAMNWGMICYEIPLSVYPDTYNKQPLMYAALASQKNHMAVYLIGVYGCAALRKKLEDGFRAAGKKLDCGKSCVRFKKLDQLPLDLIGELIGAVPMKDYIARAKKCAH